MVKTKNFFFNKFDEEKIIYNFINDNLSTSEKLNFYSLSVHKNWLSEEECLKYVMSFSEVEDNKNKYLEYKTYETNIVNFFFDIFFLYKIFVFDIDTKKKLKITDFSTLEIKLIDSLREIENLVFVIEDLNIIIFSNYDLTLPTFVNPNSINEITLLCKKNNIFLLK
jgi:hypothetical protein